MSSVREPVVASRVWRNRAQTSLRSSGSCAIQSLCRSAVVEWSGAREEPGQAEDLQRKVHAVRREHRAVRERERRRMARQCARGAGHDVPRHGGRAGKERAGRASRRVKPQTAVRFEQARRALRCESETPAHTRNRGCAERLKEADRTRGSTRPRDPSHPSRSQSLVHALCSP